VRDQFNFAVHEWLDQIEASRRAQRRKRKSISASASSRACAKSSIKHRGQNVAVFCHGGVIRMLLAILLDLPLPKTNAFEVEYASITQVALHPHMAEIELLNFTPAIWRDFIAYRRSVRTAKSYPP
jgi:broad specificity phosphatase PhoE